MREKQTIIIGAMVWVTLIICGIIFWPTLYRYDKSKFDKDTLLVRVNRLSGYTEILNSSGWEPKVSKVMEKEAHSIPNKEIEKIAVRGVFNGKGLYIFAIYNGTDWTIKRIRLSITAEAEHKKKLWQRVYDASIDVSPFSMGNYSIKLIDETPDQSPPWLFNPEDYSLIEPGKGKVEKEKNRPEGEYTGPIRFKPEVRIEQVFGYKR